MADGSEIVRDALLNHQLHKEWKLDQLIHLLRCGLLSFQAQRWVARFLDNSEKAPFRFVLKRRIVQRPPTYPNAAHDALWGPLLHKLDVNELVRRLQGGCLAPDDQRWLAELFDPNSDAPMLFAIRLPKGGQSIPDRKGQLEAFGELIAPRFEQVSNQKRLVAELMQEHQRSRSYIYEALQAYRELEETRTAMFLESLEDK
ncbi:hypothetical protein ACW7BJ_33075 [Azospirillum argentinense]